MSPLAQNMAHGFNELPGDEPVFFLSPGEGRAFKSAAFSLALAAGGDPATTLQKAKMRMLQAFALANLCFGGIIGDANREACLSAMGMEPAPYRLDATRCISYLTIESKGPIPHEFRKAIGNRIYGCDDCLAVCPWNKFAQAGREAKLAARDELRAPLHVEAATVPVQTACAEIPL